MPKLLIIDDEESVRYSFRYVFEEEGIEVLTAGTAALGLELARAHEPDAIVLDLQLPDRGGLEVFEEIQALNPQRPVVFITAHGTTDTAIEAMKQGAFDYLIKPVSLDRLSQILGRALEAARSPHVPAVLTEGEDRIIGSSAVMQEMCKALGRIAPQDVNVLILGESGTGKEFVARALHRHSRRADRPFLAINCAAIPETLLESELFGHEQGAFTGAAHRRIGKFEQCDGGTLLLDEIGDMTPALQAKMLRVLQEQRFERLGGNATLQTRVRVLAATNHHLEKAVTAGSFRADLYYRLKGVTLQVPPLRERKEDLAELSYSFLCQFNRDLGTSFQALSPETLVQFQNYAWPGNVRELQGVIRQAMLHGSGPVLLPEFLPPEFHVQKPPEEAPAHSAAQGLNLLVDSLLASGGNNLHTRAVEALERVLLDRVLRQTQGHQTQASELLGLSRNTLRQKMRLHGFAVDKVFTHEGSEEGLG